MFTAQKLLDIVFLDRCKHLWVITPIIIPNETTEWKKRFVRYTVMATNEDLVAVLKPMFPHICTSYLRKLCVGKTNDPSTMDSLISLLLQSDVPNEISNNHSSEVPLDLEEQYNIMMEILPDADPTYLRNHCEVLINDPTALTEFMNNLVVTGEYPNLLQQQRKEQRLAHLRQYTSEFNVEKFLELFPNPEAHFEDPNFISTLSNKEYYRNRDMIYGRFMNLFLWVPVKEISHVLINNKYKVLKSFKILREKGFVLERRRKLRREHPLPDNPNIHIIQELAYVTHIDEIKDFVNIKDRLKAYEFENAKKNGLLLECACCYNEVLAEDTSSCPEGHTFCNACILKSVEIANSENKTKFPCLGECTSEFTFLILQKVLKPKLFSKLALRIQLEEVKAAGIVDLECCPFCDFAMIPNPTDKVFKCYNDDCMRESCRLCYASSHIPLPCGDGGMKAEAKARKYIEDKMTEALISKCWKCNIKFIKDDGCNKMTCSCGALMCYICKKPVENYAHFGNSIGLCPLFSDTNQLHLETVQRVANVTKKEVKDRNRALKLDFDLLTDSSKTRTKNTSNF